MDILKPKDHSEEIAIFRHGVIGHICARDLEHGDLAEALRDPLDAAPAPARRRMHALLQRADLAVIPAVFRYLAGHPKREPITTIYPPRITYTPSKTQVAIAHERLDSARSLSGVLQMPFRLPPRSRWRM